MVRRLLWDNKVPETSPETRVAAAPGLAAAGPPARFLVENQVDGSLPCHTGRIERHQDEPGGLKSLGGIRMKWQTHSRGIYLLRLWTPDGTLPEKLGSQVCLEKGDELDPDRDSHRSSCKAEL